MSGQYKQHINPEPDDLARQLAAELPSPVFPYELKYVEVHGSKMAYVDEGAGDPIIFIHGAPESSYIWRNVMPYLEPYGRVMAPDLIGHGHSDKPDHLQYKFPDHVKYLDGWFKALNLKNVTLVGHDWGSILACYYAARKPNNVRGIAMIEENRISLSLIDVGNLRSLYLNVFDFIGELCRWDLAGILVSQYIITF